MNNGKILLLFTFHLLVLFTGQLMFNKKSKSYLTNEVISKAISNKFLSINGPYSLGVGEVTP
ncbi:hypothetical protein COI44_03650 [Bacillus sp. AFS088145]|nr:hypothetical protein COI44_03650 [Bacillus sp. AFS088145]